MKKLIFLSIFSLFLNQHAYARTASDQALIDDLKEGGYTEIQEAKADFERQQHSEVKLPRPSFRSNIAFGHACPEKLDIIWLDTTGDIPLHINLVIRKRNKNHYLNRTNAEPVYLKSGVTGYYREEDHFHALAFSEGGVNYQLYAGPPTINSKDEMAELADSFQ